MAVQTMRLGTTPAEATGNAAIFHCGQWNPAAQSFAAGESVSFYHPGVETMVTDNGFFGVGGGGQYFVEVTQGDVDGYHFVTVFDDEANYQTNAFIQQTGLKLKIVAQERQPDVGPLSGGFLVSLDSGRALTWSRSFGGSIGAFSVASPFGPGLLGMGYDQVFDLVPFTNSNYGVLIGRRGATSGFRLFRVESDLTVTLDIDLNTTFLSETLIPISPTQIVISDLSNAARVLTRSGDTFSLGADNTGISIQGRLANDRLWGWYPVGPTYFLATFVVSGDTITVDTVSSAYTFPSSFLGNTVLGNDALVAVTFDFGSLSWQSSVYEFSADQQFVDSEPLGTTKFPFNGNGQFVTQIDSNNMLSGGLVGNSTTKATTLVAQSAVSTGGTRVVRMSDVVPVTARRQAVTATRNCD